MKISLFFLLLFLSNVHVRQHIQDLYELENLQKNNYERHSSRLHSNALLDLFDDDGRNYDESDEEKTFDDEDSDPPINKQTTTQRTLSSTIGSASNCINQYEIKSDSLVKVKYLINDAHLIRYVSIEQPSISSKLSLKEICMLKCCTERTCDLAMLSEQQTRDGFKCYLFACNGGCPLASHEDYSVMIPKKNLDYYTKSLLNSESTVSTFQTFIQDKSTVSRTSLLVLVVFFLSLIAIFLLVIAFCYCRQIRKRGRRTKTHSVDADYLINGLYL